MPIKNNLALSPGLAFRIREKLLQNGIRAPFLEFEKGTVDTTADEALAQAGGSGSRGSALDDAKAFLIEHLQSGPLPAKEMEDLATGAGISRKTLRKAHVELGVMTRKETGKNGRWVWTLPLSGMRSNMP